MQAKPISASDNVDPRLWAQESLINEVGESLAKIIYVDSDSKFATAEQTAVISDDTDSLRVIASAFFDAGYTLSIQAVKRQ